MASIKKDKNGKWQVRVSVKYPDGKYHTKSKRFKTKKEAEIFAGETETEKVEGMSYVQSKLSFADYFMNWYETYRKPKISESSERGYQHTYNLILKYFPNKTIKDITRPEYQSFISKYGKNHAPRTVKRANSFIKSCVKDAEYDGLINKNFTQNITFTANKDKMLKVDYLNISEIKSLLSFFIQGLSTDNMSGYMIVVAMLTGARLSEIAGLQWKDINFDFKTISINKSYDYFHPQEFKATKNESSNRNIRINDNLVKILKALKRQKKGTQKELAFAKLSDNKVPSSNAVNHALRRAFDKLGIDRHNFHFHSLRHSHVAYLLSEGVDISAISKRLGHSNISVTLNIYAYLMEESQNKNDEVITKSLDQLTENNSNQNKKKVK